MYTKIICRFLLYVYNFSNVYFFQLTAQVCDTTSKIVPLIALNLLDEAADDKMNLEAMVCSSLHSKDLKHLGMYLYNVYVHNINPMDLKLLKFV